MDFVYADELKRHYIVYGNFYQLEYSTGILIECRNVLEIISRKKANELIASDNPDAIVIMMNPGSSSPKDKKAFIPTITQKEIIQAQQIKSNLLVTKPDNTQYQLMRIMHKQQWEHIRVINLSDCRNSQSKEFYKQIKVLHENTRSNIDSIFSKERHKELCGYFKNKHMYVISAWGIDSKLDSLINLAINNSYLKNRIGITEDKMHYNHPSPQNQDKKIQWLYSILKKIN